MHTYCSLFLRAVYNYFYNFRLRDSSQKNGEESYELVQVLGHGILSMAEKSLNLTFLTDTYFSSFFR